MKDSYLKCNNFIRITVNIGFENLGESTLTSTTFDQVVPSTFINATSRLEQ